MPLVTLPYGPTVFFVHWCKFFDMRAMFTLIALALISLTSCKKNDDTKPSGIPELTHLTPRCEGGTVKSIAFPFNYKSNGAEASKIELYKSPSTKITETDVSDDGMYTVYHVTPCPSQSDNAKYYFVIDKSDGSKITTPEFQVYF